MAYSRYATEMKDGDNNIYGLMDEEARAQLSDLNSAINSVEDVITYDSVSTDWESGGINGSTGANASSNTRIRLKNKIDFSQGIEGVRSLTGYDFAVYAWNKSNGNFVGAYINTGVFATSGTIVFVSEFKFASYPDYSFKIVLRNANSPSSAITTSAGANAIFKKVMFLTAADKTEIENEIASIEDIITDEKTSSDWEVGSIAVADGSDSSSNIRLRLTNKIGISTNIESVRTLTGYDVAVYAWNKTTGSYVGAYMTDRTIGASGTVAFVTKFNFAVYPNYVFRLALRYNVNPNAQITTDAAVNALFKNISVLTNDGLKKLDGTRQCVICFTFDDGLAKDWDVKHLFQLEGRVCGFALKSDVTSSQITSYLGYQSDGFEILSHSTGDATPTTEPPLRQSATILRSYGFNVRGWVTPASYLNVALRKHLRKYYEFAYTELYGAHTDPTVDPSNQLTNSEYNLQRVSMELTETYSMLTNAVDNAIASGGFLTFSGHSSHLDVEGYGAFTTENLTNLIEYIKTKEADGYCRLMKPSDCYDAYFKFRHDDIWLMMN